MQPIDVTMVAVRRPELAAAVLTSFRRHLFDRLPVRRFFLNIDPLWGDDDDDAAVELIVRSHFLNTDTEIEVSRPEKASLTAAIKRLWAKPETDCFLHLEDDWELRIPVEPRRVDDKMRGGIGQIRLSWWYPTKRFTRPVEFGTMPAFNRTKFARGVADLLDPALHPERQAYNGANLKLSAWRQQWLFRYYGSALTPAALRDIGKPWAQQRGLAKSRHAAG